MARSTSSRGAKSKYTPELALDIYHLSLLGQTDEQIAESIGIAKSTLNNWKKKHPELMDSLKRGKAVADGRVAASLFERAIGCSIKRVRWSYNKQTNQEEPIEYYETIPPDPTSMIFWLKNRQPKLWRDKPEPEDDNNDNATPVNVTIQVHDARKKVDDECQS